MDKVRDIKLNFSFEIGKAKSSQCQVHQWHKEVVRTTKQDLCFMLLNRSLGLTTLNQFILFFTCSVLEDAL